MIVIISFPTLSLANVLERPYPEGFFTCMGFFSFFFIISSIHEIVENKKNNSIKEKK